MRAITRKVWSHNSQTTKERQYVRDVRMSSPRKVKTFPELVEEMARISYNNPEYSLFYRGQPQDYTVIDGSTIMPSLFRLNGVGRNTRQSKRIVRNNSQKLKKAEDLLIEKFSSTISNDSGRLRQFSEVCWSILQHYEVTPTPMLDITTSLRVAASFATGFGKHDGVLMVLGLPHPHGSISYYVEEQLCNVRLLSICPPEVVRPYYQEGYVACTFPTREPEARGSNHDFARRLIAKFSVPQSLWSSEFPPIPQIALFPTSDMMLPVAKNIQVSVKSVK